ncbi:DUF1960-domain-containing protein [Amylocystis lapponica]|nr:DUF1960-domain-containing protein [Amylocystis lapponica]
MTKALTKVIYKPDSQSTDEFIVFINPAEYKRWKEGGQTIPLTEVVDSFQVFFSNQGAQGILGQASRQQLDSVFGSHKDDEVVAQVLQKGRVEAGNSISTNAPAATNLTKGSTIDTRGHA